MRLALKDITPQHQTAWVSSLNLPADTQSRVSTIELLAAPRRSSRCHPRWRTDCASKISFPRKATFRSARTFFVSFGSALALGGVFKKNLDLPALPNSSSNPAAPNTSSAMDASLRGRAAAFSTGSKTVMDARSSTKETSLATTSRLPPDSGSSYRTLMVREAGRWAWSSCTRRFVTTLDSAGDARPPWMTPACMRRSFWTLPTLMVYATSWCRRALSAINGSEAAESRRSFSNVSWVMLQKKLHTSSNIVRTPNFWLRPRCSICDNAHTAIRQSVRSRLPKSASSKAISVPIQLCNTPPKKLLA